MNMIDSFMKWLGSKLQWHQMPENDPIKDFTHTAVLTPTKQPNLASSTILQTFCLAIRDFEGKPDDLNYKNNNPGNTRCSPVGYLPRYGVVQCVNNFAVFESYDLGWEYLLNLVHFRAQAHPTWTILDFFTNYAPSSDGNYPNIYAKFVANRCGVPVDKCLKDLFS